MFNFDFTPVVITLIAVVITTSIAAPQINEIMSRLRTPMKQRDDKQLQEGLEITFKEVEEIRRMIEKMQFQVGRIYARKQEDDQNNSSTQELFAVRPRRRADV